MILVDSHCHLNLLNKEHDLSEYIARAHHNDVKYMQTICTKLEDLTGILEISEKHDNIFASIGIHPDEVTAEIVTNEKLINLSNHTKIIGIGETGLDYYHESTRDSKPQQIKSFQQHIITCQTTRLPIIIHNREAEKDMIDILSVEQRNSFFPGLIHCFTASKDFARKILDLNMYISIAGIVTFKNAQNLCEVVKYVPIGRLLIETDSPYLAPVPMRGKQNEPSFLRHTAEFIAELKNKTIEEIAMQTTENFFNLFTKANKIKNLE